MIFMILVIFSISCHYYHHIHSLIQFECSNRQDSITIKLRNITTLITITIQTIKMSDCPPLNIKCLLTPWKKTDPISITDINKIPHLLQTPKAKIKIREDQVLEAFRSCPHGNRTVVRGRD